MTIIGLSHVFSRFEKRTLRACIRGYRILIRGGRLGYLREIRSDLVDCAFPGSERHVSREVFGRSFENSELAIRQLLLQRHAGAQLTKKILKTIGSSSYAIMYPMPKEWCNALAANGVNVNNARSQFAWACLVAVYFLRGVFEIIRIATAAFMATMRGASVTSERYAYFNALNASNIPADGKNAGYNICIWYICWRGRLSGLESVRHGVVGAKATDVAGCRVEYIDMPYMMLRGCKNSFKFIIWGALAIVRAATSALRGRWEHAFVLSEAARAKAVQLCDSKCLAGEYLFHYSGTVYRPLWTYEAEAKGSKIVCYFYSTSEQVKLPSGYESQHFEWGAASWPHYLVWDDYQENMIRRDIDAKASIIAVGSIWFSDSSAELSQFNSPTIAVFDIQPHRQSSYFGIGTNSDYQTGMFPKVREQFVEDVYEVLTEYGLSMAFKRKRDIGKRAVKKYISLLHKISNSPNVVMVDPEISPIKVIAKCKGVISMPFTSTAHYDCSKEIPNVYYDPAGWLQKDDRGAHGVQILSGIDELRAWVKAEF
jgi:polysaccharide biosynthesis PFTS motif protein